jgi:putative transcriptional regulator
MKISLLEKRNTSVGFLNDYFLVAMPHINDSSFARTVVYVCAHSEEGAMGFIINQPQKLGFTDILLKTGLINGPDIIKLPESARDFTVRFGGPVDKGRGFVIHSDDYKVGSTLPVTDSICLTATVDILQAISGGKGPTKALMTLGYYGWAPGQLEQEIIQNGWLTCPAKHIMLFDDNMVDTYDRVLSFMGVDLIRLSQQAGNA